MSTGGEMMDKVLWSDEPEDVYLKQIVLERRREQYGSQDGGTDSLANDSLIKDLIAYQHDSRNFDNQDINDEQYFQQQQQHFDNTAANGSIQDGYEIYHPNDGSNRGDNNTQMSTMSGYSSAGKYYNAATGQQQYYEEYPPPDDQQFHDANFHQQDSFDDSQNHDGGPVEYIYPNSSPIPPRASTQRNGYIDLDDNNTLSTKDAALTEPAKAGRRAGGGGIFGAALGNVVVRRLLCASLCMFCIFLIVAAFAVVQVLSEDDVDRSFESGDGLEDFTGFPDRGPRDPEVGAPIGVPFDVNGGDSNPPSFSPSGAVQTFKTKPPTTPPTLSPMSPPTISPSAYPSNRPSLRPVTGNPTLPTATMEPTFPETQYPSFMPTITDSDAPSEQPSETPSLRPSAATLSPTTAVPIDVVTQFLAAASPLSQTVLNDPTSAQYRAALWLSRDPSYETYTEERLVQRWVMSTLFYSLNGDVWTNSDGWLDYTTECGWFSRERVCNDDNQIKELDLRANGIDGTIPVELSLLSNSLDRLSLNENRGLHGTLPTEIGTLTKLTSLRLTINEMVGTIPTEVGRLVELRTLGLGRGDFVGTVPTEIGLLTKLDSFGFEGNDLTGTIPSQLGQLRVIRFISLKSNDLRGPVPSEIGRLTRLDVLQLDNNDLTGMMPDEVCFQPGRSIDDIAIDCKEVLCLCCNDCVYDPPTAVPSSSPTFAPTIATVVTSPRNETV